MPTKTSNFLSFVYTQEIQSLLMYTCNQMCFNSRAQDDRRLSSDIITIDKNFRKYDIIIFGASGSTGQFVIEELALVTEKAKKSFSPLNSLNELVEEQQHQHIDHTPQDNNYNALHMQMKQTINWAVAGRSANNLKESLTRAELATGVKDLSQNVPMVLADLEQHSSLLEMCSQTRVLINCAGPFTHYGEAVIKACIEKGTNYVDTAFETKFLELMQLKYFEAAKEKNIHIVGACGFQSMAAEMGMNYIKKHHLRKLSSADIVLSVNLGINKSQSALGGFTRGARGIISKGLWLSAIQELTERYGVKENEGNLSLAAIRHNLTKQILPLSLNMASKWKMPDKYALTRFVEVKGFCLPWHRISPDSSNLLRSEIFKYNNNKMETFVKSRTYINLGAFLNLLFVLIFVSIFNLLARFNPTRYLMCCLSTILSGGLVASNRKIERRALSHIKFAQTFIAYGWDDIDDSISSRGDQGMTITPPKKVLVARVSGPDPNYIANATFVVSAAITILKDKDRLPDGGGVLTPGAAFKDTDIIDRLSSRNINFDLIRQF